MISKNTVLEIKMTCNSEVLKFANKTAFCYIAAIALRIQHKNNKQIIVRVIHETCHNEWDKASSLPKICQALAYEPCELWA